MASEEYLRRAIQTGKTYEELPVRIRNNLTTAEWKAKVKQFCIEKGYSWAGSLASTVCFEQEYYEDLLKSYKSWHRLYPYHLADYVNRVLRVSPFKYYCDVLSIALREEKAYDRIPNFTAADALHLLGIGRNEYISKLNALKGKRLLWRVNKSIVKEQLPTEPLELRTQPWWRISVVNLAEQEFRELSPTEHAMLTQACSPGGLAVKETDAALVQSLHRRGLIHMDIPIAAEDRFSIPPLEGFVSNMTSEQGDSTVDPVESLLYKVFVANSERMKVADLAAILNVTLRELQIALSMACRLGFATRVTGEEGSFRQARSADPDLVVLSEDEGEASLTLRDEAPDDDGEQGQAVAVVVDAEATSYLMMGALSPGLKRHSVTLFEGGRVSGADVIKELVSELWLSYEAGQSFEGDMKRLTNYTGALATTLETAKAASSGRAIELLRKESLAGLSDQAACRVLSHAYCAVVPATPLPFPPLPLTPTSPGPAYFGPTVESTSPWLLLTLYTAAQCGPTSLVFICGQRVWRLPPHLEGCTHCLLWPWDADPKLQPDPHTPALVESVFLLYHLNDMLAKTAVLAQPLFCPPPEEDTIEALEAMFAIVDVPLPLPPPAGSSCATSLLAMDKAGREVPITVDSSILVAVSDLGIAPTIGFLRLMRLPKNNTKTLPAGDVIVNWLPLSVQFGVPLYSLPLCKSVCRRGMEAGFLSLEGRTAQLAGQRVLHGKIERVWREFGGGSNPDALPLQPDKHKPLVNLPIFNLLFDGSNVQRVDLSGCTQGVGLLVHDFGREPEAGGVFAAVREEEEDLIQL